MSPVLESQGITRRFTDALDALMDETGALCCAPDPPRTGHARLFRSMYVLLRAV